MKINIISVFLCMLIAGTASAVPGISQHLDPVPVYDCSDSTNVLTEARVSGKYLILSDSDWDNINDPAINLFCVSPGNWETSRGLVTLTASGTALAPRIMALYTGDPAKDALHPAKVTDWADLASVMLLLDDADYWVFDRMSFNGNPAITSEFWEIGIGSSNNLINKARFEGIHRGLSIRHLADYNTVQLSQIGDQPDAARRDDRVCLEIKTTENEMIEAGYTADTKVITIGTKVLSNEFRNCGDSFQVTRWASSGGHQPVSAPGTIIDMNSMYITPDIYYTCDGLTQTPAGPCAISENALDFKAGSDDIGNPIQVTNNHFWGWRHSASGASIDSDGDMMTIHQEVPNLQIVGNIFFDGVRGITASSHHPEASYSTENLLVSKNIFYDIKKVNTESAQEGIGVKSMRSKDTEVSLNTFINISGYFWLWQGQAGAENTDGTYNCNTVIGSPDHGLYSAPGTNVQVDSTTLYASSSSVTGGFPDTNRVDNPGLPAESYDITIEYRSFTGSPQTITLTGASPLLSSMPPGCSSVVPGSDPKAPGDPSISAAAIGAGVAAGALALGVGAMYYRAKQS